MTPTYLHNPPPTWSTDITTLNSITLFLVSTIGPTVFVLKTDDSSSLANTTYKVYIGTNQRCTCGGGEGRGKLCVHLLFVMIKVLKVPADNSLAWQLSLTDAEVNRILAGEHLNREERKKPRREFLRKGGGMISSDRVAKSNLEEEETMTTTNRDRKDLSEDPTCSICQEDMTESELDEDKLAHCEWSCGSNFHVKCLRMCATHAKSQKKAVLCPMCRAQWKQLPSLLLRTRQTKRIPPAVPNVKCRSCRCIVQSIFFRCASCASLGHVYDLCRRCFEGGGGEGSAFHGEGLHRFVKGEASHYPVKWCAAPLPADGRRNLSDLQGREFTDHDYHVLLSLDDGMVPALHHHLLQALPTVDVAKCDTMSDGGCSLCSNPLAIERSLRQLTCSRKHVIHESCALNLLVEAQSANANGAAGAFCPLCGEDALLFAALRRQPKRRPKPNTASATNGTNANTVFCPVSTNVKREPCDRGTAKPAAALGGFNDCIIGTASSLTEVGNGSRNSFRTPKENVAIPNRSTGFAGRAKPKHRTYSKRRAIANDYSKRNNDVELLAVGSTLNCNVTKRLERVSLHEE